MACHYRVAADAKHLQFGLPEVQVGLLPAGGGTTRVTRLLGLQAAMPFLLEGKSVGPQEAMKAGLLHAVVPVRCWYVSAAHGWHEGRSNATSS